MPAPIIPWELSCIPAEIISELDRRKINRSFKYVNDSNESSGQSDSGDWSNYRGPMTSFVRFCSNGYGREYKNDGVTKIENPKPGFILSGGKSFYSGYGFNKNNSSNISIIGHMPDIHNTPHIIENDLNTSNYPINVPPPEIKSINVIIQKELFRKATIEWVCFSKKQVEYMTPYFLVPSISCVLEWGWNHFNPTSLIDLSNVSNLKKIHNNPYNLYTNHILGSRGNYDVLVGIISGFEWHIDGGKILCRTEITSPDRMYAGLSLDSSLVENTDNSSGVEVSQNPLAGILQFVTKTLPQLKVISSTTSLSDIKSLEADPTLGYFINYLKQVHPKNKWKNYIYGIFYGRDVEDTKLNNYSNHHYDFDIKNRNQDLWINLGLLMEIINYHSAPLKGLRGKEMFRIDIDDVIISGHPNLISTDGSILLIPNKRSPKYFNGLYAKNQPNANVDDFFVFDKSSLGPIIVKNKTSAKSSSQLPDYKLIKTCIQSPGAYRDNHDEIINGIRYANKSDTTSRYEFPFEGDYTVISGSKPYPAQYSGFLKNLYFNVKEFQNIIGESETRTYVDLINKVLEKVSSAAGNFWDFKLVSATGKDGLENDNLATMKIVDNRFVHTANVGSLYTFDYMDADGILQGIDFKPTLSNAKAIQTMFSKVNNPNKNVVLSDGNELLNYHFRDRLYMDEDAKYENPVKLSTSDFTETMRQLQQLQPLEGSYQITTKDIIGNVFVRRLAMPAPEVLKVLLDDDDRENNPKYLGIMPNIQTTFRIQGIGGLRTFMAFQVRNLPDPYSNKNIIFRIIDLQESIEGGNWTTSIVAGILPLTQAIKKRFSIS